MAFVSHSCPQPLKQLPLRRFPGSHQFITTAATGLTTASAAGDYVVQPAVVSAPSVAWETGFLGARITLICGVKISVA